MRHAMELKKISMWMAIAAVAIALPASMSGFGTDKAIAADEEMPIQDKMADISTEYKYLNREKRRENYNEKTIERVLKMQVLSVEAMQMSFPIAEKAGSPEEKLKILIGYKKMMAAQVKTLFDLEIALLEGRTADATKLITALGTHKADGHDAYTED